MTKETDIKRMKELVSMLSDASRAYYQESREIMSNLEYDALYDELVILEERTGTTLAGSPTQNVGYEVLSSLPKQEHEKPMLSLGKTKSVDELVAWVSDKQALLSWKLDGLTIVLTYRDGELVQALTRGNGYIGEVITSNARTFANLPLRIPYRGELILRGEAVIKYSDFEKINASISDVDAKYKNPRNLCSGSVRQLDSSITKKRNVNFYAFNLVSADGVDFKNSRKAQYEWLSSQGFDVVEYVCVTSSTIADEVQGFSEKIKTFDIPSDGLVLVYDDIEYGASLGATAKYPRDSIAFKWSDEQATTVLKYIEWSPSRTGLINPVAVFEPVELEGTVVTRASVHNVSILKQLELSSGDEITVYKANMIIPQIAENLSRSGHVDIPDTCPACGRPTTIKKETDVETLYCTNIDCPAKQLGRFCLMVSRDALNIDNLSEMTLEKFIGAGYIHQMADIFDLPEHFDEISQMEGFGEKSCKNLGEALERARHTTFARVVYSLGITGIGLANAKMLQTHFAGDIERLGVATAEELEHIEGIGPILAQNIKSYFSDEKRLAELDALLSKLDIERVETSSDDTSDKPLVGKIFVITGDVHHFANRRAIQDKIEELGGKATGSVSAKTSYLINNDISSVSGKNKKAKELGVPIISEEDFLEMIK